MNKFNVIVVGGGHAGIEAASASARMGDKTILITENIMNIGNMPCNPSIGGIGKSQLVKEIDALGGIMAEAIDLSGIQFKILNYSKGIAVRSTRAQADKILYKQIVLKLLKRLNNLTIIEGIVTKLVIKNNRVFGVELNNGCKILSKSVILTLGTFLNAKIYMGNKNINNPNLSQVRNFCKPTFMNLTNFLKDLPFKKSRLKTGTPPRIDINSINYTNLEKQISDDPLPHFSFIGNSYIHPIQVPCYLTYTNSNTHEIIFNNLKDSPVYSGLIKGIGPRYCPSIEDKIVKFANKDKHQVFLEPEGIYSNVIYPNGLSTSLPPNIQQLFIQSIPGLEHAKLLEYGYAIEYDFFDPKLLHLSLESKIIKNLFLAGQINGTTGYEEAASQGILAGINASLNNKFLEPWIPKRSQSYIGVLIDDLCTLGTDEPYRMFTSRAEYRLLLRENNADLRLTSIAYKLGLITKVRWERFNQKLNNIKRIKHDIKYFNISSCDNFIIKLNTLMPYDKKQNTNITKILLRPEINILNLNKTFKFTKVQDKEALQEIETEIKYEGYIKKQKSEIISKEILFKISFPKNFDYTQIPGLSKEAISKLNFYQPKSLGHATLISGINYSNLFLLRVWHKKLFT